MQKGLFHTVITFVIRENYLREYLYILYFSCGWLSWSVPNSKLENHKQNDLSRLWWFLKILVIIYERDTWKDICCRKIEETEWHYRPSKRWLLKKWKNKHMKHIFSRDEIQGSFFCFKDGRQPFIFCPSFFFAKNKYDEARMRRDGRWSSLCNVILIAHFNLNHTFLHFLLVWRLKCCDTSTSLILKWARRGEKCFTGLLFCCPSISLKRFTCSF